MLMDDQKFRTIIENADVAAFLALEEGDKEYLMLTLMYDFISLKKLSEMNEVQKTLYLAARLEDICQADGLPSLSEDEEIWKALPKIEEAYRRLGAVKTAEYIREFISLLPEGGVPEWEWFFESESAGTVKALDRKISDYPDGAMSSLYIKFLSENDNAAKAFMNLQ